MTQLGLAPRFRWKILGENPVERDRLASELSVHPIVAQALLNRGLNSAQACRDFFSPSLQSLPDPSLLPEIEPAIQLLKEVIDQNLPILIHGDYDVDGGSGSVLLYRLLRHLGVEARVHIPDRILDGYSFGSRSLEAIREHGAQVVVAVDNGTTAYEALAQLSQDGIRTIIVDHHLPGPTRPDCTALVNPWCVPKEEAEQIGLYRNLCGTGVAYLLAWGFLRSFRDEKSLPEGDRRFLWDALGLVALATVADVMPLEGPNRAWVAQGLRTLRNSSFPGLAELVKASGIRNDPKSTDLGFRICPRLNAAGRMAQADLAFQLLATTDSKRAPAMAAELDALNLERREVEKQEAKALEAQIETQCQKGNAVLFAGRSDAHFGVLGIVANRFMESTGLPTLLWAECEPGLARGSARAPAGMHLMKIMESAKDLFVGYGGHARAAGFHFEPSLAPAIEAALQEGATKLPPPEQPSIRIETQVTPSDLTLEVMEQMESLEPFGEGNPEPIFVSSGLTVSRLRTIGDGSHLEITLERNGHSARCLAWRMADSLASLSTGDVIDLAFRPSIQSFRGRRSVDWTFEDLRLSQG
ncbi:MAG: single-stranded-DNA-specific exonuclease RecJ [Planctomycetota bacterium]|nr:single-stranded-DNA-specific exonuclease RecJ [Planctomycetota bacterium]